jgi:membrane protein
MAFNLPFGQCSESETVNGLGKEPLMFIQALKPTSLWTLVKETFSDWSEDKAPRLAAALAYYTIFSLAPLLIIVIAIAGRILGDAAVTGEVAAQIQNLIGNEDAAKFIEEMVAAARKPTTSTVATVIGIFTLLLGASGLFGQLQDALNTIWEVAPKPGRGWLATIKDRFLSFTMVLGIGFLLLVSLVLSAALSAFGSFLGSDEESIVWQILNFVISFGVITLLFAMIYKVLPDVKIAWSDVWIGAAATALLFTLGKFLIGLYLGRSGISTTYGAAGSLVLILIWIYYSAQILFLGAEFTQVYARRFGTRIEPAKDAIPVTEDARAQQGMPSKESLGIESSNDRRQTAWDEKDIEEEMAWHERRGLYVAQEAVPASSSAPAPNISNILTGFVLGLVVAEGSRWWRSSKSEPEELGEELFEKV